MVITIPTLEATVGILKLRYLREKEIQLRDSVNTDTIANLSDQVMKL